MMCLQIHLEDVTTGNGIFSRKRAAKSARISTAISAVSFVDVTSIHFHSIQKNGETEPHILNNDVVRQCEIVSYP